MKTAQKKEMLEKQLRALEKRSEAQQPYARGKKAFTQGIAFDDNPYKSGGARYLWEYGWRNAAYVKKYC